MRLNHHGSDKTYPVNFQDRQFVFEEPAERRRGGGPKPLSAAGRLALYWSKVKITTDPNRCWEWQAGTFKTGYGMFNAGRRADGTLDVRYAHRVACELRYGPIPRDKETLHACDNKLCCNPRHLSIGTSKENVHDAIRKGRLRPSDPRPKAWKFDRELVARCLNAPRGVPAQLAREYGVNYHSLMVAVSRLRRQQASRRSAA